MNSQNLEIAVSSLEDHPDQGKLDYCKQELRNLLAIREISTDAYSQMLARLHGVKVRLRGEPDYA